MDSITLEVNLNKDGKVKPIQPQKEKVVKPKKKKETEPVAGETQTNE